MSLSDMVQKMEKQSIMKMKNKQLSGLYVFRKSFRINIKAKS